LIGIVNATIYEGRALLSDATSQLTACSNQVFFAPVCAAGVGASALQNAMKIARDVASEAQQIAKAYIKIPLDVQSAISSYTDTVRDKLEAIANEVEQCVRYSPPS
jgi:hypothetical protein